MSPVDGRTERARALREERRAQIMAAALSVFADKGYHAASITDIVEAAGVARGTFYLYFEGKHVIFLELLDDLLGRFRTSVRGVDLSPEAPPIIDQIVATLGRILDAAASSRALATIIFREAVGLDDDVDARVNTFETRLHDYVRVSLDNGVGMGLLVPHDTDVVATCIYGSIRQVIHRYVVVQDDQFDRTHVARQLVQHHLFGLLKQA